VRISNSHNRDENQIPQKGNTMKKLYVIVGPDFSDKSEILGKFMDDSAENLQIVNEGAVIQAINLEGLNKDPNYRYNIISVVVRSQLLRDYNVIANCDNISVEALILWKRIAFEHNAKCILVLFDADQEVAMHKLTKLNLPKEQEDRLVPKLAEQFKRYDDLAKILNDKLNTIRRELADEIIEGDALVSSQEE